MGTFFRRSRRRLVQNVTDTTYEVKAWPANFKKCGVLDRILMSSWSAELWLHN